MLPVRLALVLPLAAASFAIASCTAESADTPPATGNPPQQEEPKKPTETPETPGPAAPAGLDLTIEGGTKVEGLRPAPTTEAAKLANAPKLAKLTLAKGVPGQSLDGSFVFDDTNGDVKELIVQVLGASDHFVFEVPASDLAAKAVNLGLVKLASSFSSGTRLLYIGLRDADGNVGSYLTATLVVGEDAPLAVCSMPAVQFLSTIPSQPTGFFQTQNGSSDTYGVGSQYAVIGRGRLSLDVGDCTKLLLAGDAEGMKPVGWDNVLVVEYRDTPGGEVKKRAAFGDSSFSGVAVKGTSETVPQARQPDVVGTDVGVPNGGMNFGHKADTVDLMAFAPAGATKFEVSFIILDAGSVGSTTDVWIRPRK